MKEKHTVGGKMARNSRKIAILLLLFILIQTIVVECPQREHVGAPKKTFFSRQTLANVHDFSDLA